MKTADWNSYPAKLMFLACNYNSDKVVALLLNHALFPGSKYPTSRQLLQAQAGFGRLTIHFAAQKGYFRVIEEMLKAEERGARSLSTESHVTGGDEIASHDNHNKLLCIPDNFGCLPIHLVLGLHEPRGAGPTLDLMIRYDARYATMFPASLSHQPGVPDSTWKQTSMLHTQDRSGYLPIRVASQGNAPGVKAMLQREFQAFHECVQHSRHTAAIKTTSGVAICSSLAHRMASFRSTSH